MSLSPLAFARRRWIDGRPIVTMYLPGDGDDMRDQPPEVDGDDPESLPGLASAAERVLEFVSWFGDGRVDQSIDGSETPPALFSRDLVVVALAARNGATDGA